MPANPSTPEVTRADREIAASVLPPIVRESVLAGEHDVSGECAATVQAFARHRLAHSPARGGSELRDALAHHTSISIEAALDAVRSDDMRRWSGAIYDHLRNHQHLLAALASTDMAGAGDDVDRRELDRLLSDWRKSLANPASWLDCLRAACPAPPVEGLTSGADTALRQAHLASVDVVEVLASPKATATASLRLDAATVERCAQVADFNVTNGQSIGWSTGAKSIAQQIRALTDSGTAALHPVDSRAQGGEK